MAVLQPKLAVLDETDSGLDIDALRIVAGGVNALRAPDRAIVVVTHYQRLLNYIVPDVVHVLSEGRIVSRAARSWRWSSRRRATAGLTPPEAAGGRGFSRATRASHVLIRMTPTTEAPQAPMTATPTATDPFRPMPPVPRRCARHRRQPPWLADLRDGRSRRFLAEGFPTTRDEEFRFTSVAPIAERVFGPAAGDASAAGAALKGRFVVPGLDAHELVFVNGGFAPPSRT